MFILLAVVNGRNTLMKHCILYLLSGRRADNGRATYNVRVSKTINVSPRWVLFVLWSSS